ncbi:MAM domain-containing glycosylphosphatidylinositol anchor protein 1 [Callorhinchus milii]|uniref:MAM domain-containing glycosylphosphatidylinositol anchor protein 1 n=1 Tax=Callorhinchus milii TaxID=7868 RepID=UPI001C3FDD51|nr:MAM domain-containing glycosylphosphatidylinositol anchor protein 1 [Callorhinchus milii]
MAKRPSSSTVPLATFPRLGVRLRHSPANARIVHSGQACVVKENVNERVYTIREGSTLVLVCLVTGHPRPKVRWTKTAGSASDKFQETAVFNETLRIASIGRLQGGRYYCKADNGVSGPVIKSIRVDVQYLDEPVLTVHQSVSDVRGENYYRERTVFLRCTVNSNPPARFTWKRGTEVVTQNQDEGVDIYEPLYTQGETKVLKLKDLRPQDYANFTCLVSVRNVCGIPDKATSFMLKNSTAPPVLSLSVSEVLVVDPGEDVQVDCSVLSGDPVPSVQWAFSLGPLPPNSQVQEGSLSLSRVQTQNSGSYNCSATNGVGNRVKKAVTILVRALRNGRFWITPDPFHDAERIQLEREVRISCQVEAVPPEELRYTWYKNGRLLVGTGNRIMISRNEQEPGITNLEIIDMRFTDCATYTCVASLRGGSVPDISIDVNISTSIVPPSLVVPRGGGLVEVREGSAAELQCLVTGKPKPVVLWSRADKAVPMPTGAMEVESYDGILRLENVTRDASGSFRCRTGRYNGLNVKPREAVVQLSVQFPPEVDVGYQEVRQAQGRPVLLSCLLVAGNPLRVASATWSFNGKQLQAARAEPKLTSEWNLEQVTIDSYGLYHCSISNGMGTATCRFNLTGRAYAPEFYFDTPSPVLFQSADRYQYKLQWTQKEPDAVDAVLKYKLDIRELERPTYWREPQYVPVNRTIETGKLLIYTVSDLRIPLTYKLSLTPFTSYGPGDMSTRIIQYTNPSPPVPPGNRNCGFEDVNICGFTQDAKDNFDWSRQSNKTQNPKQTPNTGPRIDKSGKQSGYFMYVETSSPRSAGDKARLISPLYNVTAKRRFGGQSVSVLHCVRFYYHMYGKHIGTLNVWVRALQSNTVEVQVWTLSGNQGNQWKQANVTINPVGPFQIIFEAVRGRGYLGDIGLDDVSISQSACTKWAQKDDTQTKPFILGPKSI